MNSKIKGGKIAPNNMELNYQFDSRTGYSNFPLNHLNHKNIEDLKKSKGSCQICKNDNPDIENMTLPAQVLNSKEGTQCKYLGENFKDINTDPEYLEDILQNNHDTAKEITLNDCIEISNYIETLNNKTGKDYKVKFRPVLNNTTPLLHNSCSIGKWDGGLNMPPAIIEEEQELLNIMRSNWAKDQELIDAKSQNVRGTQFYNPEYCMDGVTLNYLINPNSQGTSYDPSLEYPGSINEIGFFAPRIMVREKVLRAEGQEGRRWGWRRGSQKESGLTYGDVIDQQYAFNDPNIEQSLLNFFGYTRREEYQLRSQGKSPVQEILCSLATPRPGGALSPLEYIVISNYQGVIETAQHLDQVVRCLH